MGEPRVILEELLALCLQRITVEEETRTSETELMQVVKNFEEVRKRWLHAELELKKYKELLVKSDVAKAALEVKLKHARNQLDLEMKRRHKTEGDYQYLQRQMQLMCDILVHDSRSSSCLNDEQKSLLATFEHKGGNATLHRSSRRLCVIDESSFLSHSDISYDRTDDDVDVDTTTLKPLRSRVREKRRSSMGQSVGALTGRRGKSRNACAELLEKESVEEVEVVMKTSMKTPEGGAQVHMVVEVTQEGGDVVLSDQTSVWSPSDETQTEPEPQTKLEENAASRPPPSGRAERTLKHVFLSKTVILPEVCPPCGKRMRFGKVVVKCRNCRAVAHPECKQKLSEGCSASTGPSAQQKSLESLAPAIHPRVPHLVVDCVAEIERRGLQERGLYRVPGGERLVKELRDRFLQGKTPLMLSKVHDVHALCGLLKDFLRTLKEPLVTFRLHRSFMEASELADEDKSTTKMFQAIAELPKANRDTLAFLMLHLQKVMKSPQCQMDQNNLSRVFGPTLVGHGMSEPTPSTILRDINTQPKVIGRLLSLPESYWRRVLTVVQTDQSLSSSQDDGHGRFFRPLTSPELNSRYEAASRGTLRGQTRNQGNAVSSKGRVEPGRRFFTSPS